MKLLASGGSAALREWQTPGERRTTVVLTTLALALAVYYAVAIVRTGGDTVLLVPLIGAIAVVAVLAHPAIGVYVLFGSALLFEQFLIAGIPTITQTRFFQNVNAYTPIPLRFSLADLLMLLTIAAVAARRMRANDVPLRMGAFGWAVLAYLSVFILGTVIGIARGGAWNADVALAELRAPVHLCVTYFLAANIVRDRRQLPVFMWLFVLVVGIKAIQGLLSYRRALELSYPVEAVTGREDVIFFSAAVALMVAAAVLGIRNRFVYVLLLLQPAILVVELVANRRVGLIALGVTLVAVTLLTVLTDPKRGGILAAAACLSFAAYAMVFWESEGPIAEPIRAVRSVFDTSATSIVDQASNAWREAENRNIGYTVGQLPLTGVGLGQRYLVEREPTPVPFIYWRYITHNAVLWLWLKAGVLGAFALWFLVARALLVGAALYRRLREPWLRLVVALPIALVISQVIFSSVDLGLTYSRTMIVLGTSLGLAALVAELHPPTPRAHASPTP